MTLSKIFIVSQTVAKSSSASWSTAFEPQGEDPLLVKATVVRRFLIISIIDTLTVRTVLPAVSRPVHEAIGESVPHLEIVIKTQVSPVVVLEEGVDLRVGVRLCVSSMEGRLKRV